MGDLNNTEAAREHLLPETDPVYRLRSFPIHASDDDPELRRRYRPFLLDDKISSSDWIMNLELATAAKMVETEILSQGKDRLRVLVLYGSLRSRSYSKLLAYEASRILFRLGCDVRVYDPSGLPVKDDQQHDHPKVQELRELSKWSDGHVWVSPEQHGNLATDRRLQEPDRLDPAFYWQRPADTGTDTGYRPGKRRFTVFQRSELATYSRPLDEDVHNPEPELHSESMDAFHRRRRPGGRGQPPQTELKQGEAGRLYGGVCQVYNHHAAAF